MTKEEASKDLEAGEDELDEWYLLPEAVVRLGPRLMCVIFLGIKEYLVRVVQVRIEQSLVGNNVE